MFFSGKNHKEQKIEQLLLENYNKYYRLAYSYVHHEADAADIVQNGAYKAIKNSDALKQEEEGREDRYENIDLRRALDAMEERDKAVIELRYFEDMKLEDIARVLGENQNTVKSRLYRGLKKLRLELTDTWQWE